MPTVTPMTSTDPIRPEAVLLDLRARTKAEVLAALAARAGEITGCDPRTVVRALIDRERLGSTGVGVGVALPHADIHGLHRPIALFARLAEPIDWEAIDDQSVELVLVVLSPTTNGEAAPSLLAKFARLLRSTEVRRRLVSCRTADRAFEIFAGGV